MNGHLAFVLHSDQMDVDHGPQHLQGGSHICQPHYLILEMLLREVTETQGVDGPQKCVITIIVRRVKSRSISCCTDGVSHHPCVEWDCIQLSLGCRSQI